MRLTARPIAVLIITGLLAFAGFASNAKAANTVYACFNAYGYPIPVSLAGLQATNAYGNWVSIPSVKLTDRNGCVTYNLYGPYTRYNLRIVTAGVTPDQQGLILGVSRYYAPGSYAGTYWLGRWNTTIVRGQLTDSWITDMSNGGSSPSASQLVAAFSDRLGPSLKGSVLCPRNVANDSDCDGVSDASDSYPYNYRWSH